MEIRVLGTASIGGVPEWDCACKTCSSARANPAQRRTRSSIAVSLTGSKHVLVDATHDIKTQLEQSGLTPHNGNTRSSAIDSLLLTHGHADHTVGLAEFCTGKSFSIPVYGPPDLIDFLFGTDENPAYFRQLGRLAKDYVVPHKLPPNQKLTLLGGITADGFEVPHTKRLPNGSRYPSSTYAYEISDGEKRFIYAPDIGDLDAHFLERVAGADLLMVDACFWFDDELNRVSGIPVTSKELGHVPLSEAVDVLNKTDVKRVIYTHFNHTNPVLDRDQPYANIVREAGHELAQDGTVITL